MKTIFIAIFLFFISLTVVKADNTGSTFQIDTMTYWPHKEVPYFSEEHVNVTGKFIPDGQYDSILNTANFQADITFSYKNFLLAIDYDPLDGYVRKGQDADYGKKMFTGWYGNEYKKLTEIQNGGKYPTVPYFVDMFYLYDPSGYVPTDGKIKIMDINTGQFSQHQIYDEDIRKYTFVFAASLTPRGLETGFTLYPEVLRPELQYFLSSFFPISEGNLKNRPVAADDNYNIVQRKLLVNEFIKEDPFNWTIKATMEGEEKVGFAPVTSEGNHIIYGKFGEYTFALHPKDEEEITDSVGVRWQRITNFVMNIEKNGYVVIQAQNNNAGILQTNFSYYGPREVTFTAQDLWLDWVSVPGADTVEAGKVLRAFIEQ